jgi:hypothetical protein
VSLPTCCLWFEVDLNYIPADLGDDRIARRSQAASGYFLQHLRRAANYEFDKLMAGHAGFCCYLFNLGAREASHVSPLIAFILRHGLAPLLIMPARTDGVTASTW